MTEVEMKARLRELALNLQGVVCDLDLGVQFDSVCLGTVKWVMEELHNLSVAPTTTEGTGYTPDMDAVRRADVLKLRIHKYKAALSLIATAENSALDLAYCKGVARAALEPEER